MSVIRVRDLVKAYGDTEAVRGVSLTIDQGEVFALLGPNGAGKSTTVEILEGHRARDRGEVSVLGIDPGTAGREFRDRIGIVLQSSGIEDELTVDEALRLYSHAYSAPRDAAEVLELVGLADKGPERVKRLSGGQQRRIDLALGLIGDPEVLFLDEPTTGFDPSARRRAWDVIDGLRALGTTIVLTTHYMEEAQRLADRVGVIVGGRIVAVGTPAELMQSAGETVIGFGLRPGIGEPPLPTTGVTRSGHRIVVRTGAPTRVLHDLTTWALDHGVDLDDLAVSRPSLEDVYLSLAEGAETVVSGSADGN